MVKAIQASAGYGHGSVHDEILHNIDFTAEKGKITTIIGHNGCGKSTLLKALLGFLPLDSGEILIDGTPLSQLSAQEAARKMAYLPQGKGIPDISAGRMVLHGRFPYLNYPRKYKKTDFDIARSAMEQMGIADLAEKHMAELSGGLRQKVYIAMALAQQAPIIVMDEPTTYLDIGQQLKFAELVRELAENGKTVILVLHDILLALKISDSIAAMKNGQIVQVGTADEILKSNVLEDIYGVRINSVMTPNGLQYYYEMS